MLSTPESKQSRVAAYSQRSKQNYTPDQESNHILIKQVNTLIKGKDQSTGYIRVPPPCDFPFDSPIQSSLKLST